MGRPNRTHRTTRAGSYVVCVMLAVCCSGRAGEPQEPCYQFEVEESFGPVDGPSRPRREVCFTEAELDWTPLELVPDSGQTLNGFAAERKDAEFVFDGKNVTGQTVTWTRKPAEGGHFMASSVTVSVSPHVPTPAFTLVFGRGPRLRVPSGCLALEVVPHEAGAVGIDDYEIRNTCAASGALGKAVSYKMASGTVVAREFVCSSKSTDGPRKTTLLLSKDVPGGVCGICVEVDDKRRGRMKGCVSIVSMTPAPVPDSLEEFKEAAFAFAPPEGYRRAKDAMAGETVRYVTEEGAFIAVTVGTLPKGGIEAAWMDLATKKDGTSRSIDRAHHLAGHQTFTTWDKPAGVGCIHAEHAGRGYEVTISGLGHRTPKEAAALLRGWRWLRAK